MPHSDKNTPAPAAREAEAVTSPLLIEAGFVHGFFTRRGGASLPPWDSLSFSMAQGDDPVAVMENRRRAARRLGVDERALHYLSQVHGVAARALIESDDPDVVVHEVGDITLSRTPRVACGVRTADCVPVLLADRETGAVAAVHSGWKGTTLGVVSVGVDRLRELIGRRGDIVAAIGPCISVCCFEVGDDVAAQLSACSSAGDTALGWGPPSEKARARGGEARTRRVDLRKIIVAQLTERGLPLTSIDDVPGCTFCEPDRFHSYRRDAERSGRLLSAIVARAVA
ncbi:MAG: peptidoglycan editing factor PgeF [Polyangiaceae bacterium]